MRTFFRVALGFLATGALTACAVLPLMGYGGVIYLPQGRVELPREMSLAACAEAVRSAAVLENPASLGRFEPAEAIPRMARLEGNVLGVCSAPDGARYLILPGDIQPRPLGSIDR